METTRHIKGRDEIEIWNQVAADFRAEPDLLQYRAHLEQQNRSILLDIDIDLGGGFEGGYASTIFSAEFANPDGFQFAVHDDHFFDEVGKFFGMQDIEIGDGDLDPKLIIKGNDEARIRTIFKAEETRQVLTSLTDFTFEISGAEEPGEDSRLELIIEEGITDPERLRRIYRVFLGTLNLISPASL